VRLSEFETLLAVRQPIHALMSKGHPLARSGAVRLRDCLRYPIAMPTHLYGVRNVLDKAVLRSSIKLQPVIESDSFEFLRHYARQDDTISFQIPIGIASGRKAGDDVSCPIDERDVPPGILYLGQLRGRTLPIAVSRFAAQISSALAKMFEEAQPR
jgi:DNA-binding transcriptional LysR family regulator